MNYQGESGARYILKIVLLLLLLLKSSSGEFIFDATVPLYPKVEEAISRAQSWLAGRQSKKDGGWGNDGVNSMAVLALMVNGTTPGRGKYGTHVAKAIDYIINTQQPNGLMAVGKAGPMYQHALATLALAEAYGMTHNPDIRASLIQAIDLIVETQDDGGGWRYQPKKTPGDLSVTVMQVMALRSCAEFGIYVPDETIAQAIKFIKNCWNEKEQGFGYMGRGVINFNRAGAGVVCLQSVGLYDDPIIPEAIATISKKSTEHAKNRSYYWYGHYYASIALYRYGGKSWKEYYPMICRKILNDWKKSGHYGGTLDTAWAVLVMGVPFRYLPIYQR